MIDFSRSGENKGKLVTRRMFLLSIGKTVVFFGILSRLFSLQISQNKKYKTLSDNNRLREWKVIPHRGIIIDYFDVKIADNNQVYQLHIIPEDIENKNLLFFKLRRLVNLTDKEILKINKKIKTKKPWEPIVILNNLDWANFSKLNLHLHELHGIKPVVSVARQYPQRNSFSHAIGYVSTASENDFINKEFLSEVYVPGLKVGKTGLERFFDQKLIGKAGYQRYEVNAYGKRIREIDLIKGIEGQGLKTTFDSEVQNFVHDLMQDKSGAVCVMDIFSGEIIAMVSTPSFDPNEFVHGISSKSWKSLISNKKRPLINKCISGLYPPGSVIKPLVALSALEFDVISPNLVVECTGHIDFYGQKYHCWKKKGHGFIKLRNAIKQSCDIYFYEVARRLGVDRLAITAKRFGLGIKNLYEFDEEKKGVVPNTKWKLNAIGKGWYLGETLIAGIGQGYYQCSPLQICLMTAQLANGGFRIAPKILVSQEEHDLKREIRLWEQFKNNKVKDFNVNEEPINEPNVDAELINQKKLFRNQENIKFVNEAMFASTNEVYGTSYSSRHTESKYLFAGKTGTSQIKRITEEERELEIKNEDRPYEDRDHALYAAFAPYDDPKYALSIIVEHGGTGGGTAAPIAKKIIKKVLDRDILRSKIKINQTSI